VAAQIQGFGHRLKFARQGDGAAELVANPPVWPKEATAEDMPEVSNSFTLLVSSSGVRLARVAAEGPLAEGAGVAVAVVGALVVPSADSNLSKNPARLVSAVADKINVQTKLLLTDFFIARVIVRKNRHLSMFPTHLQLERAHPEMRPIGSAWPARPEMEKASSLPAAQGGGNVPQSGFFSR